MFVIRAVKGKNMAAADMAEGDAYIKVILKPLTQLKKCLQ